MHEDGLIARWRRLLFPRHFNVNASIRTAQMLSTSWRIFSVIVSYMALAGMHTTAASPLKQIDR